MVQRVFETKLYSLLSPPTHPPTQKVILTPFLNMRTYPHCRPVQQNVKLQHYMEKYWTAGVTYPFCYVERGSGGKPVIKVKVTALGYYCEIKMKIIHAKVSKHNFLM